MKIFLVILVSLSTSYFLSGCAINKTITLKTKKVSEERLKNGEPVRIGYTKPLASSECVFITRKAEVWNADKFKGQFTFGSSYGILQKNALAHANQMQKSNPNYIYLNIPNQTTINDMYLRPTDEAEMLFYRCKNPPAIYKSPF